MCAVLRVCQAVLSAGRIFLSLSLSLQSAHCRQPVTFSPVAFEFVSTASHHTQTNHSASGTSLPTERLADTRSTRANQQDGILFYLFQTEIFVAAIQHPQIVQQHSDQPIQSNTAKLRGPFFCDISALDLIKSLVSIPLRAIPTLFRRYTSRVENRALFKSMTNPYASKIRQKVCSCHRQQGIHCVFSARADWATSLIRGALVHGDNS